MATTKKAAPAKKAAAKRAAKTEAKDVEKASSPDLANELKKQEQLAQERVDRRAKLGQKSRPEPTLGDDPQPTQLPA